MAENLVQHRGTSSVWERDRSLFSLRRWSPGACDPERWLAALSAGGLLLWALRRPARTGFALAAGGAALAWWAAIGREDRRERRNRFAERWHGSRTDVVHEAAEESFPASDAPSWTPTTANTAAGPGTTRA